MSHTATPTRLRWRADLLDLGAQEAATAGDLQAVAVKVAAANDARAEADLLERLDAAKASGDGVRGIALELREFRAQSRQRVRVAAQPLDGFVEPDDEDLVQMIGGN